MSDGTAAAAVAASSGGAAADDDSSFEPALISWRLNNLSRFVFTISAYKLVALILTIPAVTRDTDSADDAEPE